ASTARVAASAVTTVHGRVTTRLGLIGGVAAVVPADGLVQLGELAGVRAVTPDARLHFQSLQPAAPAALAAAAVDPVSVYGKEVRADLAHQAGWRGEGVTVALLDTGVASSPDLSGRVLPVTDELTGATSPCENLSGEPTCADGFGHGTFMAGIIAGSGASSDGKYQGIAPQAKLVSIKVGASDGSADVSNLLAGIQWAVSFRHRYNIRVLNLSLGTNSTQSWQVDPLNYAVERAWAAGIAVVVSASNRGPAPGTISKPADDPWVITVGAVDDRQTRSVSDDRSPDFSGRGPTVNGLVKPDVAAPGAHLVSLRSVGSSIDQQFPNYVAGAYRQGSGTSMAAAVVSGVSALVLSARPTMSPNRLKYALARTARPAAMTLPTAVGAGVVDAYAAVNAPPGLANLGLPRSSGEGKLSLSRGTVLVETNDPFQTVVQGSQTAQLLTWDPIGYLTGDWSGSTWYATPWSTARWYSTSWYGDHWVGHNWEGCSWDAGQDADCFYGHNWEGSAWYGAWD
ncbi:MAG: S8 family peptidase, partial [Nocardioidaceae bacterium]|nr:S8 family peptidase [Nocardioidaceae bacterium]